MAAVSRNRRQLKQQSVVALLLLTVLCSNDTLTVLAQLSFLGATGHGWLNFSHSAAAVETSIEILQFQNGQLVQVG